MKLNTHALQRVAAPTTRRELIEMAWTHGYGVPEYGNVFPLAWAVQAIRAQGAPRTADEFLLRCLNEPDFLIVVRLPYAGYYRSAGGVA
jgi:hypothetical protein